MTSATVLDPCCGGRAFYFDKESPGVLFCDNRVWSGELCDGRRYEVNPDMLADVTELPFYDCSFPLADLKIAPPEVKSGFGFSILLHEDDGQGPDGVMTLPPATVVKE